MWGRWTRNTMVVQTETVDDLNPENFHPLPDDPEALICEVYELYDGFVIRQKNSKLSWCRYNQYDSVSSLQRHAWSEPGTGQTQYQSSSREMYFPSKAEAVQKAVELEKADVARLAEKRRTEAQQAAEIKRRNEFVEQKVWR